MTVEDRMDGPRIARESGNEVGWNRDFVGHGLDPMHRWATTSLREPRRGAFDQQGAAPDAVCLTSRDRAVQAGGLQVAAPTDCLGARHVEVVVGEKEMGESACAVRAASSTLQRCECRSWLDVDGEARLMRFSEHSFNVKTRRQRSVAQLRERVTHCVVPA